MSDLGVEDSGGNEDLGGTLDSFRAKPSTDPFNGTTLGDEYDYDIEESLNAFFWDELVPTCIVYTLTFILGLVGNVLIIFTTLRYRKMKSTTNVFLASLASADLLLIVFCVPVKLAKLFSYTWTFGFFICKLVYYMQSVSAICSVLTLTAMSVERYYAIVHPMKAQYVCTISQAQKVIVVTWISSFLLAIPILFAQIHMQVGVRVKGFWCVRDYDSPNVWRAHETYMLLLILVIPTVVMGVAYTKICIEIWHVMQRRQELTGVKILNVKHDKSSANSEGLTTDRKESKKYPRKTYADYGDGEPHVKQVIKMLVAVVVIYVICWGPLLVDSLLQSYGVLPYMKFGIQKYIATTFHLMAYFNSCINPIIYGFMSKNFRESFHKALFCRGRRGSASFRNPSSYADKTSSTRYAESSPPKSS